MLKFLAVTLLFKTSLATYQYNELHNEIFTYFNETSTKAEFAYKIVNKINNGFRQWFFTILFCEFTYFENRIVKYIQNLNNPVLLINSCPFDDKEKVRQKVNKHGETVYIVSSNEITVEKNADVIKAMIRTGVWQPRSAVIFVINEPVEVDSYFYHTMKKHFQILWSQRITNSVLVVWRDYMRIYAYNPYIDVVYEVTHKTDITKILAKQYYNLYGNELRLSVYRKIFVSDETGPVRCNSSKLITTVTSILNATCIPVTPRDGATSGGLLENGTFTGTLADLIDGYTDIDFNLRILLNDYYGYIDTTYPLLQNELCFLVKKSDKQSSFTTTIKLFTANVLTAFAIMVIVLSLTSVVAYKIERLIWFDGRHQTIGETIMELVKCFLRQTCDVKFLGPVFRILMMVVILYSLIVNSVVDGIITSAITYPRFKPDILTLMDLANSNLTLAVHARHVKLFKASLSPNYEELRLSPLVIFNDHQFKKAITERQFQYALLMTKTDSLWVSRKQSNMKDGKPLFHPVPECPLPFFTVYGLQYGSPYLPIVNKLQSYLNQAGILNLWYTNEEYVFNPKYNTKLYAEIQYKGGNEQKKRLSMENMQEVFFVWLIGLVISIVVLVFELSYNALVKPWLI